MTVEATKNITVEDIRKLALPLETHVVAGHGLLGRVVNWITVIYPGDKMASKTPQTGEVILLASEEGRRQQKTTDVEVIRWAAEHEASAVVLNDPPTPAAIVEAKAYGMPVLSLPSGSRVRLIEKAIVSLLVDRKIQIERRGTQIYKQLTQISSRNEGMPELINTMARLTNKAVAIQDKRMRVVFSSVQPDLVAAWDDIEQFLRRNENLPVEYQDRHRVIEVDNFVQMQSLPIPGLARLVSPIMTSEVGRGYLSIIGRDDDLDDIDLLVTEHGAAACALEMAKQKAVSDTEKRLRGTFLDRLLIGDVNTQEAIRQGERFDHDMTRAHQAIVLSWQNKEKAPSNRRLETLVNGVINNQHSEALVWQREREQEVLVFHAVPRENPVDHSIKLAEAFRVEIQRQYANHKVAIGLGQPAREISAWRTTYNDAVQALGLAVRLQTDTPLYIGDLGVYQLILSLSDREKLTEFTERTLGPLLEYDMRQHADLVKTLESFFACHGNLSQTAEMLIVHRNTLLYRMNRITEIAEIDLDRPETRLALHLALTIRRLLALK